MSMYILIKSKTKITPFLLLDPNKGSIEVNGMSLMEDPEVFYAPMIEWLYEYFRNPQDTIVNIDLKYFNCNSFRILLIFIKALSKIRDYGYKMEANWFHDKDDDDLRNSGYAFSTLAKVKFNIVEKIQDLDSRTVSPA